MITATTQTPRGTPAGRTARTARRLARHGIVLAAVGLLSRFIDAGWDDIVVSFHSLTTSNAELLIATLGLEAAWLWSLAQVYRSSLVAMGGSVTRTQAVRVSMGAFTGSSREAARLAASSPHASSSSSETPLPPQLRRWSFPGGSR